MKKNTGVIVMWIQVLAVLFCILSCLYILVMGGGQGAHRGPAIVCLAALIATALYTSKGYKKNAAKDYKVMLLLCAAASLLCLLPLIYNSDLIINRTGLAAVLALGYALCFGLYLVLALVPDLGRTKSNTIIIIIFCIFAAATVFFTIYRPGMLFGDGTRADTMRIMRLNCMSWLAVNAGTCNYFKYVDKASRGSK